MPKFIKVTGINGTVCAINADTITRMYSSYDFDQKRECTVISFSDGSTVRSFRESLKEILDRINGDGALDFPEANPKEVTVTLAAGGRLTVRADRIRAGGHFGDNLETDVYVQNSQGKETLYAVVEPPGTIRQKIKEALGAEE